MIPLPLADLTLKYQRKLILHFVKIVCTTISSKRSRSRWGNESWCMTLPLNLFPTAGQVTICHINGKARIPNIHRYYFDKKEMAEKEREDWIKRQEAQYLAFGVVS